MNSKNNKKMSSWSATDQDIRHSGIMKVVYRLEVTAELWSLVFLMGLKYHDISVEIVQVK